MAHIAARRTPRARAHRPRELAEPVGNPVADGHREAFHDPLYHYEQPYHVAPFPAAIIANAPVACECCVTMSGQWSVVSTPSARWCVMTGVRWSVISTVSGACAPHGGIEGSLC